MKCRKNGTVSLRKGGEKHAEEKGKKTKEQHEGEWGTHQRVPHGSIPFWSWNDKLEEGELRRQINNMKKLNMNGFFMHARGGLETEYMSDEWYAAINVCIDEARKLGMEAWAYDENGWPSGFAGGKLLNDPRNFTRFLLFLPFYTVFHGNRHFTLAFCRFLMYNKKVVKEPLQEDLWNFTSIIRSFS